MNAHGALPTAENVIFTSIRAFDWSATPLGPREAWPTALTAIYEMMIASPFAMCAGWGPKLTLIYNEAYADFLAARHPTALGQPMAEVWHDVWADIHPLIERTMAGEQVHQVDMHLVMTRKGYDEDTYWTFAYSPLRDRDAITGFLDVAIETTAGVIAGQRRDAAEADLRELNATLESRVATLAQERDQLWRLSRSPFVVCDTQGVWLSASPVWTDILGWTEAELVGRTSAWMEHPDDHERNRDKLVDVAAGEVMLNFDNRFRHRDGHYRWFSWTAVSEGDRLFGVARDITEQVEQTDLLANTEEALRQSQKMEAVGQLTGGVAHDFNNLLTVIKSSTDLLKRPNLAEERRARYVAAISDTVDRAAKLTGQLLAFARRQALKPVVFAACASVRGLADMMKTLTGSRIRITIDVLGTPSFVNVDASQFDTALVNMVVNARDAMNGEGEITIAVKRAESIPALRAHAAIDGSYVAVSLRDTGSGIPADVVQRIFEPFFTTKETGKGTGLGLSQVFGFAKQSGGDVTVESTVGEGTTFTLYLPRVPAPEQPMAADETVALVDGQGTRVLVVEDNVAVGTFGVQSLSDLGYHTVLAADGASALVELVKGADRFDVVFSDVMMPGMSGIELGQEIRRLYPDLPVVLTSGYSHILAENGTFGFELLHKPYSIEQLSQMLRKVATPQRRKRKPST